MGSNVSPLPVSHISNRAGSEEKNRKKKHNLLPIKILFHYLLFSFTITVISIKKRQVRANMFLRVLLNIEEHFNIFS